MFRIEHDVATGEIKKIDLTPEEIAQREAESLAFAAHKTAQEAEAKEKAAAKAAAEAKLEALGLTTDDLKALGL